MKTIAIACTAICLMAVSVAQASPPATTAAKSCGTAFGLKVQVTKGKVSCKGARKVVKSGFSQKGCGIPNRRPCKAGSFRCRNDTTFGRKVKGYCYVLKRSKPLGSDFTDYKLGSFSKAVVLK